MPRKKKTVITNNKTAKHRQGKKRKIVENAENKNKNKKLKLDFMQISQINPFVSNFDIKGLIVHIGKKITTKKGASFKPLIIAQEPKETFSINIYGKKKKKIKRF